MVPIHIVTNTCRAIPFPVVIAVFPHVVLTGAPKVVRPAHALGAVPLAMPVALRFTKLGIVDLATVPKVPKDVVADALRAIPRPVSVAVLTAFILTGGAKVVPPAEALAAIPLPVAMALCLARSISVDLTELPVEPSHVVTDTLRVIPRAMVVAVLPTVRLTGRPKVVPPASARGTIPLTVSVALHVISACRTSDSRLNNSKCQCEACENKQSRDFHDRME